MWLWIILIWLSAVLIAFSPNLLFPFLAIFWLYGFFNLVIVTGSHFIKVDPPRKPIEFVWIAIFYCTYNDFCEEGLLSCVRLNYPYKEIFVLDDSTDPAIRREINEICKKHGLKLMRRVDRKGFKAGAINHALRLLPDKFKYVIITDSDEILPADFIQACLAYFTSERIAFVQANHYCYNKDRPWTKWLGLGVDLHWNHYQHYRNRYGLVNFLGHGAMMRVKALKEVGGLPEIACEDLALTIELAKGGYRGVFAKDIRCGESFPPTYSAFRQRHKRWCWGTVELIKRYGWKILTAKQLKWYEKVDLLIPLNNLPLVCLLPIFILITIMTPSCVFARIEITIPSLISILSPALIFHEVKGLKRFGKALAINTIAYLSLFVLSILYVLKALFKPAHFIVTPKGSFSKFEPSYLLDMLVGIALILHSLLWGYGINLIGLGCLFSFWLMKKYG